MKTIRKAVNLQERKNKKTDCANYGKLLWSSIFVTVLPNLLL